MEAKDPNSAAQTQEADCVEGKMEKAWGVAAVGVWEAREQSNRDGTAVPSD